MAPRGSKRTSVGGAGGAAKRRSADDPAVCKCDSIAEAIKKADRSVLPKHAADMLVPMLRPSLAVPRGERHQYQATVVDMAGKVLETLAGAAEQNLAERKAAVEGVHQDREERRAAFAAAKAALPGLQDAVAKQKERLAEAELASEAAQDAWREAGEVLKKSEKARAAAEKEREVLKAAVETVEKLKVQAAQSLPNGKALLKQLVHTCTEHGVEKGLLEAAAKVFKKEAASREQFDLVSADHFLATVQRLSETVDASAKALEPAHAEAQQALAARAEAKRVAEEAAKACEAGLAEARTAEKAGAHEVKAAEKRLSHWLHDAKVTMDGYDEQAEALERFRAGALAAFTELRDLRPAEPEAEEAPAPGQRADPGEAAARDEAEDPAVGGA